MDEERLRRDIEHLEREIREYDKDIERDYAKIKEYSREAERCLEAAAKGGDFGHTPEENRKGAESFYRDIEKVKKRIRDKEGKRDYLIDLANGYRRMLSESGGSSAGQPAPAPKRRSVPSGGMNRTSYYSSGSSIRKIDKDKLKDAMKIVFAYALIEIAIAIVSRKLFGLPFIPETLAMIAGPFLFAAFVSKNFFGAAEPKKGAKVFITFGLAAMVAMVCMSEYTVTSMIFIIIVCAGTALVLERMSGSR